MPRDGLFVKSIQTRLEPGRASTGEQADDKQHHGDGDEDVKQRQRDAGSGTRDSTKTK